MSGLKFVKPRLVVLCDMAIGDNTGNRREMNVRVGLTNLQYPRVLRINNVLKVGVYLPFFHLQ